MKKLLEWHDKYTLKGLVAFLILFTALYPKLPSVHIEKTWVYIRLEDFFICAAAVIWLIQVVRRKVSIPKWFAGAIGLYWLVGLVSVVFAIIFIGPHIANFYSHVAFLQFARRIEYMILFFIAFSTVRSVKDIRDYFIILSITVGGILLYGIGQRYYLDLWSKFPEFFQKYSFCFPSFQTGNEEFAKGVPLCLPHDARITSTFGGHYDLAAYLVLVIPIFIGVFVSVKKMWWRIGTFALFMGALLLLNFTSSRTSFMAYLCGAIFTLIIYRKKWFIIPVLIISLLFLVIFSGSTAKRLLSTFRISSIVTTSQGQLVGEVLPPDLKNKVSKVQAPPPAQDLQVGSAAIALPSKKTPVATKSAVVSKTLTPAELKRLGLANGSIELSSVSGTFLVQKALVYDISFTTRFQSEWPNAWTAFQRNPLLGSGYSSITLATDNDYFRALGETGLLGLLSFVFIFIIFGICLSELGPHVQSPLAKGFIYGLTGGVFGLALNATLIDVFEASKVAENLWMFLGIGVGGLFLYKHKTIPYRERLKKIFTSNTAITIYFLFFTAAFFIGSVNNFFVADDFTWLRWAASATLTDIIKYFTDAQNFFYRPLDKVIVFFLYNLSAFRPQGYHAFTLVLHFLAVMAVYKLSIRLFKSKFLAFVTAFIFLAHPIHGENIYWFSTISVTLGSVFILYALLAFMRFRERKSIFSYIVAFVLSVLAFLSYEMSVILPILFVAVDMFITKPKKNWGTFIAYIPFILLIPAYYVVRFLTHAFSGGGDYSYNISHLIPNVVGNFLGYIGIFLGGEAFFSLYDALRGSLRTNAFIFAMIIVLLLIILTLVVFTYRTKLMHYVRTGLGRNAFFGLVFAFIALLPFLALGNISERYLYLASAGFCIALIAVVQSLFKQRLLLLIFVLLVGIGSQVENARESTNWNKAGEVTRNTLSLFRIDHETIDPSTNFYFVDIPVKKYGVWVFPTGVQDALWFIYRENMPMIYQINTVQNAKAAALNSTAVENHIFQFDQNGKVIRIQ